MMFPMKNSDNLSSRPMKINTCKYLLQKFGIPSPLIAKVFINMSDSEERDSVSEGGDEHDEIDEGETSNKNDGLAEMMSKILNQKVTNKNPILAKRKTAMMKEVENEHLKREDVKQNRMERKVKREKFLVLPDPLTNDFERQLRKVATKGGNT